MVPLSFNEWWTHKTHKLFRSKLMAKLQAILDAQARLDAAVQANTAKIDALIAAQAGSATPAEQAEIAAAIDASAAALDANNAKS
jgi:hypothetical protein